MSWKPSAFWLVTAALWLAAAPLAFAAESILEGRVVDDSGNALPGATVVLQNEGAAFHERMSLTDPSGRFRFGALPPGPGYRLTVSLSGHATVIFSDLQLSSSRTLTQDVTLRLGKELNETVRVQGKSDILDTEKVTGSTTFSSTFIAELPILGRDYQDILTLAPGVTDVNHTGNPNIHGARDTSVGTLVDGVATTDPFTGHFGQNLNIESIQELEVITSAASAQFGRAQGGFANIVTKSGGNEFQGTFKMFVRSNRLDGDGAGQEDPELQGGLNGGQLMSNLSFTDLKPFLSLSGAFVRDKLWYYLSSEFILEETPVNALTEAYVFRTRGYREFLKTTWQINPTHSLVLSVILDSETVENQGITSLRDVLSGYSTHRGGPTLTLRENSVFNPSVLLESSLSWFDNRFSQLPTMDPDTNGNGVLFVDDRPDLGGNGDGIFDASERDPGEDWDLDGFYDINELILGDVDRDGSVNTGRNCEGSQHEDLNCNYRLDAEVDSNLNGRLDPEEDTGIPCFAVRNCVPVDVFGAVTAISGTAGNGRWDTEDRNANGVLDTLGDSGYTVAPFWVDANGNRKADPGEYHAPLPPDQDLLTDPEGRTYGPYAYQFEDHRKRATWKEDLSLFVPDLGGTHEIKLGGVYEHEGYDSDTTQRPQVSFPLTSVQPIASPKEPATSPSSVDTVSAQLGIPGNVNNTAVGDNLGLYLEDTYKPRPNLTLNLGVRFDRETLQSFGYTPVDPVAERSDYDALMDISGFDTRPFDGLTPVGLCRDPIHTCPETSDLPLAAMTSQLRGLAFERMTRHNQDIDVLSGLLKYVTGGTSVFGGGVGSRVRHPEEFTITNSNLSPRLSLSWDPWADGKTKVFASWGRFYDKVFLRSLILEQGPDSVTRVYQFEPRGVDDLGIPNNRIGKPLFQSPLSMTAVDRSLKTPYSVEGTIGAQREISPEMSVSIRYVTRDYHDQLQDVDVNHRIEIDPATGRPADRIGEAKCDSIKGTCANGPNGVTDLYVENFYFNRILLLGNLNEQTYRGWELELVRRLHRKWQMEASYTYSIAQGDAESYLSALGNDPSLTEWESGYLNYDQRHVIKVNAIAFLPHDWRLGGTAVWASGLPFSETANFSDSDDVGYHQIRRLFGQLGITGYGLTQQPRNTHRNPASYLFNARVMKSFVMGKASSSAFLEVYNLLNSDNLRVHELVVVPGSGPGGPGYLPPATVRMVGDRDFGRRFQVGIQIDF